jgi:methionyl-tRNA formyltransferase
MGNPSFAIPTLKAIIQSEHELIAVVSNPPKRIGRGRSLSHTPVGKFSQDNKIPLIESQDLRSDELKNELHILRPDVFIVVAFKILPNPIIDIPKYGSLNLHASLLPKYRGAGPIQWALMNGDKKTGVTVFQIKPKVDTGDILMQKEVDILNDDNMLSLGNRLCEYGAHMMIEVLNNIEAEGKVNGIRQDPKLATPAPKIRKNMTEIDWKWTSKKIHNWVRGLTPFPGMSTNYKGKRLRVFDTSIQPGANLSPGTIIEAGGDRLIIATVDGALRIHELQIEGKKRMNADDFLRGNKMQSGDLLG